MRVILTDLDGTLIDHHSYSAEEARPALAAARAAGVPIVPCSSKTLTEMRQLAARLGLAPSPLVVENGGAVWFPEEWPRVPARAVPAPGGGVWVVLGARAEQLQPHLKLIATAAGVAVRGFSQMTTGEIAAHTALRLEDAEMARGRQFSEPFLCEGREPDLATLDAAARTVGARVTRGGRFFHLTGATDKGAAADVVLATCTQGTRSLGLGDAPNDLPLLRVVDDPAIVPGPFGLHADLVRALPSARHAPAPGPAGWNVVVLRWLTETAGHA